MFHDHINISLFLRIREKGLNLLNYHDNQFVLMCKKHESSYTFLMPTIQDALKIIATKRDLFFKTYTDDELVQMIKEMIPEVDGNFAPLRGKDTFAKYAPGAPYIFRS